MHDQRRLCVNLLWTALKGRRGREGSSEVGVLCIPASHIPAGICVKGWRQGGGLWLLPLRADQHARTWKMQNTG